MFSSRKKYQTVVMLVGVALIAFVLGLLSGGVFKVSDATFVGTAGLTANQPCDTSVLNTSDPFGIVLADPLNFRIGPGLDYDIITTLDFCTPVSLEGRTADSAWVLIQMPGNLEGWVFSYYIQSNIDFDDLEIKAGYGGPNASGGNTGQKSINVVIQYNNAAAFVSGMPANSETFAVLNPSTGPGAKSVAVGSGYSDADGNITLTFTMPVTWADGSKIESGKMTLTVTTGNDTQTAYLTYYTN